MYARLCYKVDQVAEKLEVLTSLLDGNDRFTHGLWVMLDDLKDELTSVCIELSSKQDEHNEREEQYKNFLNRLDVLFKNKKDFKGNFFTEYLAKECYDQGKIKRLTVLDLMQYLIYLVKKDLYNGVTE